MYLYQRQRTERTAQRRCLHAFEQGIIAYTCTVLLSITSCCCRAADTTYATQNGGQWPFYIDAPGSPAGGQMAVPLSQDFWNYLMASSVNEWGLTTYEQDWLYNLFDGAF